MLTNSHFNGWATIQFPLSFSFFLELPSNNRAFSGIVNRFENVFLAVETNCNSGCWLNELRDYSSIVTVSLVRYLREISLLLQKQGSTLSRKTSQIYDQPFESSLTRTRTTSPNQFSYETKRISLRSCYVFRRFSSTTDILVLPSPIVPSNASSLSECLNGSILDIVMPSTQTSYSVRFVDDMYARKWYFIIQTKISRYLMEMLAEIEENLCSTRNAHEIKAMGWLAEQIKTDETIVKSWRPVFLIITNAELCLFSTMPINKQQCRHVDSAYPILTCR